MPEGEQDLYYAFWMKIFIPCSVNFSLQLYMYIFHETMFWLLISIIFSEGKTLVEKYQRYAIFVNLFYSQLEEE